MFPGRQQATSNFITALYISFQFLHGKSRWKRCHSRVFRATVKLITRVTINIDLIHVTSLEAGPDLCDWHKSRQLTWWLHCALPRITDPIPLGRAGWAGCCPASISPLLFNKRISCGVCAQQETLTFPDIIREWPCREHSLGQRDRLSLLRRKNSVFSYQLITDWKDLRQNAWQDLFMLVVFEKESFIEGSF